MSVIYIKMNSSALISHPTIQVKDVADILSDDPELLQAAKNLSLGNYEDRKKENIIISIMKLMEEIQKLSADVTILPIGETTDTVVQIVEKETEKQRKKKVRMERLKAAFIALVCFFGTGFTIMSFHTDIGIRSLFEDFYHVAGLPYKKGLGVYELFYSLGLGAGMIIFFNHFSKKKLTKDPTPLQVEMYNYEDSVNSALVEMDEKMKNHEKNREKKEK